MSSPTLTRRAALFGAATSSLALAIPAAAAVGSNGHCRPELAEAAEAFRAAHVANAEADRAQSEATRQFGDAVTKANLSVRIDMLGGRMRIRGYDTVDYAIDTINRDYADRIARAEARQGEALAKVLPRPASLRVERDRLLAAARPVQERYNQLRAEWKIDEVNDAETEAYDRWRHAADRLMEFTPQSLAEVLVIAKAMHAAGTESERWYDLPNSRFLGKLAEVA